MPYTDVDIFREKGTKSVSKKVWKSLNFMKKWVKIVIYLTSSCVIWAFFWHEWASLKLE
jgi:hypothetical protein